MNTTPEQVIAECCVPFEALLATDEAANTDLMERLFELNRFLNGEFKSALHDAVELTNNPDAELPFTGVADWREAYLEQAKRNVRQLYQARFYLAAYAARAGLVALLDADEPTPAILH